MSPQPSIELPAVTRLAPMVLVLLGCSLRDPRVSSPSCASSSECSRSDVCFLGECRPPASNLSIVRVEVRPPAASKFGLKRQQIDVAQSVLNDFTLAVPLAANGTVKQAQAAGVPAAVAGAAVVFTDHAPVIPDRVEQIVAATDAGAYTARVPQGLWDIVVQMPPPFPPVRMAPLDTTAPVVDFLLPEDSQFPRLDGGLLNATDGGVIAGASVTAIDSQGTPISAPSLTDADGGYTLILPPGTSQPSLQIGPATDLDAGVPAAAALDPFPTYPPQPYSPAISLQLPEVAQVSGRVLDTAGAGVPFARVYARSADATPWTFARSIVADSAGAYVFNLRAGSYLVEAAPPGDATSPALSPQQPVGVPAPAPVDLVCPPKVRRHGTVFGPDGRPVGANFQVVATRLSDGVVPTRAAVTTPTNAAGLYTVLADGGRWRFEINPPADSPLPRKIVQFDIDGNDFDFSALPTVQISRPLEVVGTVKGTAAGVPDAPVEDAVVSFFSLDTNGTSVFLGSARTDAQGRYAAVLPDVAQPGIGP